MHERRHRSAFGHIDQQSVGLNDKVDNLIGPVRPFVIFGILGRRKQIARVGSETAQTNSGP
jgi:hypothetical protein